MRRIFSLAFAKQEVARDLVIVSELFEKEGRCKTHAPDTSDRSHETAGNQHLLWPSCALENGTTRETSDDAVERVVLAAVVAQCGVETVVYHSQNTGRVT